MALGEWPTPGQCACAFRVHKEGTEVTGTATGAGTGVLVATAVAAILYTFRYAGSSVQWLPQI